VYFLEFSYPTVLYAGLPLLVGIIAYRLLWYQRPLYRHSLTEVFAKNSILHRRLHHRVLFVLRTLILFSLLLLIARPEWVDKRSQIHGEGRDIILALDVSGSMQVFDDARDRRSRIDVAKKEAVGFIEKRIDDPMGIVVFGRDAMSLAPLTLDKEMLKTIISDLKLGVVNEEGTSLGTGLATAVNRLRTSKAKSKVIILLTDGEPTPQTDSVTPETAMELAQHFDIKVYTVGIGSAQGGIVRGPFGTMHRTQFRLDVDLLKKIAEKTGGQFFRANRPADMKRIYKKIDELERTDYTTNIFQQRYQAFTAFFWIVLLLVGLELLSKFLIWRGI